MNFHSLWQRLIIFIKVFTLAEWIGLIKIRMSGQKWKEHPDFHRLIIFLVSCADNRYHVVCKRIDRESHLIISNNTGNPTFSIQLRKNTRDLVVFGQIFISKEYQKVIDYLEKFKDESMNIVDCGANIGCSSAYFKAIFPKSRIICIEPEARNFQLLELNLQQFEKSSMISINKAIWNKKTSLNLFAREQSVDAFHVMIKESEDAIIGQVNTITIPDLMSELRIDTIDILKMDIEGAEKSIFEDLDELERFIHKVRVLAIEVHEEFIKESEVVSILKGLNFETSVSGEYLVGIKKSWKG